MNTKFSRMGLFLIVSIIITLIASIILTWFDITVFFLNENQLLYLLSSMAQIIGGLFALTLTAYVFFVDKFKDATLIDDTLYDATETILSRYFHTLIVIAAISGTAIFSCILGITALNNCTNIYPFIINESVFLFLICVISILALGIMLLDPNKLDKEIKRLKQRADKYYNRSTPASGDLAEFITTYNKLDLLLLDFANECLGTDRIYHSNKPKPIQALQILQSYEILNHSLYSELHALRMHRNALVHGLEPKVSQDICIRISNIYDALSNAFETLKTYGNKSSQYSYAIQKLYALSSSSSATHSPTSSAET